MSTKEAKRTNGKILKDAREYLTLVGQLGKIRIALAAETNLSHEKMEFLDSLAPIVDSSMEVVKEVGTVTQALAELPSSAPKYKRRAVGKNLTEMMLRHAVHMNEVFAAILRAGELVSADNGIAPESIPSGEE